MSNVSNIVSINRGFDKLDKMSLITKLSSSAVSTWEEIRYQKMTLNAYASI